MGWRGLDIREAGERLVFRAYLQDSAGAKVTSGTTSLRLYELQNDGTLESYDFADNTFKTGALTTATLAMTHRTGANGAYNTGIWSVALTTLTGFVEGGIYFAEVINTGASPTEQIQEFQFGSGALADVVLWAGGAPAAMTGDAYARIGAAGAGLTALGDTRLARLDADVSSRLATSGYTAPTTPPTVTQIRQEMDANSTKLDVTVGSRLASAGYTAPPSVNDIAAAVWGAGSRTLSSFGSLVADLVTGVWGAAAKVITGGVLDPAYDAAKSASSQASVNGLPTAAQVSDAVWDEALAGHTTAGTAGKALGDAASGAGGGTVDLTEVTTMLGDMQGAGFNTATDSLKATRDAIDLISPDTTDKIAVDHNTGGTDALRCVDGNGAGQPATVRAYLTSDRNAGVNTVRAVGKLGDDGRFLAPIYLYALPYTLVYELDGFEAKSVEVTPSAG